MAARRRIDLARLNPCLSTATTVLEDPLSTRVLSGLPPMIVMPLEQIMGTKLFSGKRYLVNGDPGSRYESPDAAYHVDDRARIALNDVLSLFAP